MPLEPNTRLGNYELLSELGSGGMGEVYRAKDLKLGRVVAIKVLPQEMATDSQRLSRFEQEARAASALNHPNIVTIYEIGEHDGAPYIAMEYVEGRTLREILANGPLPNDRLVRYATQMAEGLAKAHQAGIVHRDLKPENVVVSNDGYVKILDFGLAKLMPLEDVGSDVATMDHQATTPGTIVGTVSYMSPEQAKGQPTDFRSDQFSFGAVVYEMATGERAFGRDSAAETLSAVLKDEPKFDGAIGEVVGRCLKKSPGERWSSTEELLSAVAKAGTHQTESKAPSVAVLPFANMSADPEQEYFCEGIAEDIINALTRVRNLSVVARTSAFAFKGQNIDLRELGDKLNVSHVLEGSVRKAGRRLRITAQLIKAADGYHLWSERFDRDLDDIFAIQDEISLAIVEQLRVKLVDDEKEAIVKRPTDSPELHNLYLLGRYHFNRFTIEDARRSQEYFEKAIELDPSYAPAHAMLATVHVQSSSGGLNVVPPREAVPKATAAAERALELDPANSDAHAILAAIGVFHERNWPKVLEHSRKALELDPSAAMAHGTYAYYLSISRRFDEAIAEIEKAVVLDPLAPIMTQNAAWHCYLARDFERARTYCQKTFNLAPDFAWAHYIVGLIEVQAGRLDQAKSAFERGRGTGSMNGYIGYALAAMGDHEGARTLLEEVERDVASGKDSRYSEALIHFGLGDTERCLDALEEMTKETPAILVVSAWLNVDPFWDPLRSDPRFQELLRRMNFPE